MAHFVIIPTSDNVDRIDQVVRTLFATKSYQLPRGEWLVVYDGTARQLSDLMNISGGSLGANAIILNFVGYYGHANKDIWEWIATSAT